MRKISPLLVRLLALVVVLVATAVAVLLIPIATSIGWVVLSVLSAGSAVEAAIRMVANWRHARHIRRVGINPQEYAQPQFPDHLFKPKKEKVASETKDK